jgi:hypothetical protein
MGKKVEGVSVKKHNYRRAPQKKKGEGQRNSSEERRKPVAKYLTRASRERWRRAAPPTDPAFTVRDGGRNKRIQVNIVCTRNDCVNIKSFRLS